jgi:hypothetical protein
MGKRIRYPKNKKQEIEQKEEKKEEEQKTHFVLDVHDVTISSNSIIGK